MDYDAIVIGGGHAGIEACLALSRMGFSTLLVTQSLDAIGRLSCNPAIGGLAKGNIVREVDALGGEMGRLIDRSMIQYRILNRRRGPAVQAPRAQADKFTYSRLAKETLEGQKGLHIFMDTVVDIVEDENRNFREIVTERGHHISSRVLVLTTGTFMEGKIFIGEYDAPCGRLNERAAIGLGSALRAKGFEAGRLKTGTPARVRRSSLDLDAMERQDADTDVIPFSFSDQAIDRPMVPCYITWTNGMTHQIIRDHIKESPLYGGKIVGKGPRYCPSIEDKVVRFPERERHQVFIEPEGLGTEEMYLNGLSSSLPEYVQDQFIHSVRGLEHAEIMRPAYAVEYDYLNPRGLYPSLESKRMHGLFVAGQTNGTSGYEEAACQGLMAGINAALSLRGEKPLVLRRDEAYIGVLIDDLVTMGTNEPYRMFTSRAEYRLHLSHETADQRLTEKGFAVGLQGQDAMDRLQKKLEGITAVKELLKERSYQKKNGYQALKMPEVEISDMKAEMPELATYGEAILSQAENEVKYEGYVQKEDREIARFEKNEELVIPEGFPYDEVVGLSAEGREKFKKVLPLSVGQASRINGVRMSDVALLILNLKRRSRHE